MRLWSLPEATLIRGIESDHYVRVAKHGAWLAGSTAEGTIRVWSVPDGKLLAILDTGLPYAASRGTSQDDALLIVTGREDEVQFWNVPRGTLLNTLPAGSGVNVVIDPTGEMAALADKNGAVHVWNIGRVRRLCTIPAAEATPQDGMHAEMALKDPGLGREERPWLRLAAALIQLRCQQNVTVGAEPKCLAVGALNIEV